MHRVSSRLGKLSSFVHRHLRHSFKDTSSEEISRSGSNDTDLSLADEESDPDQFSTMSFPWVPKLRPLTAMSDTYSSRSRSFEFNLPDTLVDSSTSLILNGYWACPLAALPGEAPVIPVFHPSASFDASPPPPARMPFFYPLLSQPQEPVYDAFHMTSASPDLLGQNQRIWERMFATLVCPVLANFWILLHSYPDVDARLLALGFSMVDGPTVDIQLLKNVEGINGKRLYSQLITHKVVWKNKVDIWRQRLDQYIGVVEDAWQQGQVDDISTSFAKKDLERRFPRTVVVDERLRAPDDVGSVPWSTFALLELLWTEVNEVMERWTKEDAFELMPALEKISNEWESCWVDKGSICSDDTMVGGDGGDGGDGGSEDNGDDLSRI